MKAIKRNRKAKIWNIFSWIFSLIFLALGILNMIYISYIPGIFYILLSIIYIPHYNTFLKIKLGFKIPMIFLLLIALFILWGSLAVGDLIELFEDYLGY